MRFSFTVPGEPRGKARARSTRGGHHYTPQSTKDYEALVASIAAPFMRGREPHEGPVEVNIDAYFGVPKSFKGKKLDDANNARIRCVKKPDYDNINKIICDAMNGIVYKDDSQVADGSTTKRYYITPHVEVEVIFHD
jgi:Holliday junction resolvase RusA-like endonuclease